MPTAAWLRRALAVLVLLQLAACAGLPSRAPVTPSQALAAPQGTPLRSIAEASRPASTAAQDSGFRLLHDAGHAFDARIALADNASVSLDVQYYVLDNDEVGGHFLHALRDAAARGVRVRLLIDDLHAGPNIELLCAMAAQPGIEVRLFNPLPARSGGVASRLVRSLHEFGRINHRMHNKLLVADGVLSVSGGRNIAAEYFMRASATNFIDMDVLAAGPVVGQQAAAFDAYWNSPYAYPVQQLAILGGGTEPQPRKPHYNDVDTVPAAQDIFGQTSLTQQLQAGALALTWAPVRLFADDPDKISRPDFDSRFAGSVSQSVLAAIRAARTRVFISSPYFVPGEPGMEVMRDAAARGVLTTVVTNSLGATDEPLVYARYARYRGQMLDLGIMVYEMSPTLSQRAGTLGRFGQTTGRLHSKLAVIDGQRVYVGSMNLDGRSASLNTEAGLLIESTQLAGQFKFLLDTDRFRSAYLVRRGADGGTEWVEQAEDGLQTSHLEEPDGDWMVALRTWLASLFVQEEWL
ncbi:phosphatidylserine/phosphatidylglycerophosphate/cardiolipin synthase family protein [uncultured Ramlibacter sp.]|uniref:phospholipase D-like domain-containing protein n=1 Tax=uncultured Ramlibacter sp. TaxID=260755 RepID=UPI00260B1F0E|nr:phospholipase D family protein [uncultured Ramlibacter sp.]